MSSSSDEALPGRMTAGASLRLVPFDDASSDMGAELGRLHAALLPGSPVALLGSRFLERFYYRVLPRMGLVFGQVARVDGEPAGFIAVTHDSFGFMRKAIRRQFLRIAGVMAGSVVRSPGRLGAILEAARILRGLPASRDGSPTGEILSMGVLPEFRSRGFRARTRLLIGPPLLAAAMEQLAGRGIDRVRAIVDADNLEARLFYASQGWMPGLQGVPGWRKETVEYLWSRGNDRHAAAGARPAEEP